MLIAVRAYNNVPKFNGCKVGTVQKTSGEGIRFDEDIANGYRAYGDTNCSSSYIPRFRNGHVERVMTPQEARLYIRDGSIGWLLYGDDNYLYIVTNIPDIKIENTNPQIKQRKENKIMLNLRDAFKDVQFGKAGRDFQLSFDGHICFKGKYFDGKALNDTLGLSFDLEGLIYVMPSQTINAGDIVVKGNKAFYYDGSLFIDLDSGLKAEYVPTKVFNMTFYSVVKNLAGDMFKGQANNNLLPLLLLGDRQGSDSSDLLAFMLLGQGLKLDFGSQPQATQKEAE